MPRTLRQHVQEAARIWSICGVKTLIPTKERRAPVRVGVSNERLVYAISIRAIVDKFDRTGWAKKYLESSDDVCAETWRSIPVHAVCPLCLGRAPAERIGKGRVYCKPCGAFVWPKNLKGLVSADIRGMRAALNDGEIRCKAERGERG
jgi:hypothetical protein